VLDEVVGVLWTLTGLPHERRLWVLGMVCFRVFDIFKPIPVSWCELLPAGWGVVMDDVCAGLMARGVVLLYMMYRAYGTA
jgi:phosphatidylglycerophosphatase A